MSTIRVGNIGPLTGNTSTIADPGVSGGGMSLVNMGSQTASGSTVTFTGIPSWARRITLVFNNITKSGTTYAFGARVGSGSLATSGYVSHYTYLTISGGNGTDSTSFTSAFTGSNTIGGGHWVFYYSGGNVWVSSYLFTAYSGSTYYTGQGGGYVTLSGTLDRVALIYGSDTFTGGTITGFYE